MYDCYFYSKSSWQVYIMKKQNIHLLYLFFHECLKSPRTWNGITGSHVALMLNIWGTAWLFSETVAFFYSAINSLGEELVHFHAKFVPTPARISIWIEFFLGQLLWGEGRGSRQGGRLCLEPCLALAVEHLGHSILFQAAWTSSTLECNAYFPVS